MFTKSQVNHKVVLLGSGVCSYVHRVIFWGCREQMENTCSGIQGVGWGSLFINDPPHHLQNHPPHICCGRSGGLFTHQTICAEACINVHLLENVAGDAHKSSHEHRLKARVNSIKIFSTHAVTAQCFECFKPNGMFLSRL